MTNKKELSERDICTKFITPALQQAGWDMQKQVREEVCFTDGRIYVKGNLTTRGNRKRADYILYYKPNIPVAIIEAKDNNHSVMAGMQQGLDYAAILDIPTVFSSNGDGFFEHDRTAISGNVEREIPLHEFPTPEQLWERYKRYKGIETPEAERISAQDYFFDGTSRGPRYYQQIAINRTVEAIATGQQRILLTMATGTGKTYTAFQIIHRLWKAGAKKRILFLADRNALIDQTRRGDFRHFKDKMTVIKHKKIDKSYEIYLALYQGLTNYDEDKDAYREFSHDFFDLIVIDECHRGSAAADSAWREILDYFKKATHIGLTATPKETKTVSSSEYFGDPIYTYSLKQGIQDGFLAPYKVLRVGLNIDLEGWRPEAGKTDKSGLLVEDRVYNRKDYDKSLVIDERTEAVARKITEYLSKTNRFDKTIVFCVDIDHAERMRTALANANSELMAQNPKYIMQITGDNDEGKRELDNFINPEERYPVIATTSKLMTTGVDAQTCRLIVLDSNIGSMTEFKQIIGRGTRLFDGKEYFTIYDFVDAYHHFADPEWDGEPLAPVEKPEKPKTGEPPRPPYGPDEPPEPRVKIRVKLRDGKEREIQHMASTLFYDASGKPISAEEFMEKLFGKLPEFFKNEDELRRIWASPITRRALLEKLAEAGFGREQLSLMQTLINAENSDLFDVLEYIYNGDFQPIPREVRVAKAQRQIFSSLSNQQKEFIEFVLSKYIETGVEELDQEKLPSLLLLKYKAIEDAKEILGTVEAIRNMFINFQKFLYLQPGVALSDR